MTRTYALIQQALEAMNDLIACGMEYPEAHCRVVTDRNLSDKHAEMLTKAYDEEHRDLEWDRRAKRTASDCS